MYVANMNFFDGHNMVVAGAEVTNHDGKLNERIKKGIVREVKIIEAIETKVKGKREK